VTVEFVLRTDERMRTKLFVEPKGRVREEVTLFSCIPDDVQSYKNWKSCWIENKEFKKWSKSDWPQNILGEFVPGKILSAKTIDNYEESSLKGPIVAYRSFIMEAGSKKRLPMVVFARLKKHLKVEDFDEMKMNEDEMKTLSDDLKEDVWAPILVWHPPLVSRSKEVDPTDVLDHAIAYTNALLRQEFKNSGWDSFVETEQFK
jgi:hypothetical protein